MSPINCTPISVGYIHSRSFGVKYNIYSDLVFQKLPFSFCWLFFFVTVERCEVALLWTKMGRPPFVRPSIMRNSNVYKISGTDEWRLLFIHKMVTIIMHLLQLFINASKPFLISFNSTSMKGERNIWWGNEVKVGGRALGLLTKLPGRSRTSRS